MSDLKRASVIAVFLIVVLRISIGWQFLYEGLWKIEHPWSAEGYLKSAQGPMRDYYRDMLEDPDDLNWLDYAKVSEQWDQWLASFTAHYELDDETKAKLAELVDGKKTYYSIKVALPTKWRNSPSLSEVINYNAETEMFELDGVKHLMPKELAALKKFAPLKDVSPEDAKRNKRYQDVLTRLDKEQKRLGFREKLRATLKGDPEVAGQVNEEQKGTVDGFRPGAVYDYTERIERINELLAEADQAFEHDHLNYHRSRLSEARAASVLRIRGLDKEMKDAAANLLSIEQLAKGPVPPADTKIARINNQTIWALTILGTLLILGLGSRMAALAGAGMLFSFYMVQPPWPWLGLPEGLGPEHAYIVNKNLIEVFALLAIASLPTGTWFGIDGLIYRLWRKVVAGADNAIPKPTPVPQSSK